MTSTPPEATGYEKSDVNPFFIFGLAFIIFIGIVVSLIALNEYYVYTKEQMLYQSLAPVAQDMQQLHAHEVEILNSYGMVDQQKAIYRLPIERAMDLTAQALQKQITALPDTARTE